MCYVGWCDSGASGGNNVNFKPCCYVGWCDSGASGGNNVHFEPAITWDGAIVAHGASSGNNVNFENQLLCVNAIGPWSNSFLRAKHCRLL